ncbi:LPS export ABC transporter periplasmic protein LptC [Candidatus Venteria ishoeyi]|uniref:Lipopolysaccharide export system protein LptC n=1 Tax=Candidatus Venteria ishoeyi TaxID=1899563 RepID=A0A1H6FDR9_9GAMM|nr:LPS export ABC transporter periplasmic protein LptC [Candidatus Venteria ishoeyi]MDM8544875.1 LPS export ABC transporter periplasmic protein LptC [Candidatus Venteria ishoeyi]SEH07451.1 lipopolysaccharide exporter periplasmic protein [Candidatus Venteria ishoeyi]SEH08212.1 lipopolysaccharide exporter periplasmic protein [Candidatus Venteria ishoeyi]
MPKLLLALILCAAASFWLLKTLEKTNTVHAKLEIDYVPDYAMVDFISTATNLNGQIDYQLQAQMLKHYPQIDTELVQPYLVFYQENKPRWYVRALQGRVSTDAQIIELQGQVQIWQYDLSGYLQLHIKTQNLRIKPAEEFVETDNSAEIHTPQGTTHSMGMRAWLKTQQMELFSQVTGIYENEENE